MFKVLYAKWSFPVASPFQAKSKIDWEYTNPDALSNEIHSGSARIIMFLSA
jgi:hypothetical protein